MSRAPFPRQLDEPVERVSPFGRGLLVGLAIVVPVWVVVALLGWAVAWW